MFKRLYWFTLIAMLASIALLTPHPSMAQGGRGGGLGGGGVGGGGFGGSSLSNVREGDIASYTHILTPGDRGEWPITAREGETIIVSAKSRAFDPAMELIDSSGKVIAQNDDIRPGEQESLILHRFEKAGAYKVLVKGFKSVGGGQYEFTIQRFISSLAPIGQRTAGALDQSRLKWFRFPVDAGQTIVATARAAGFEPSVSVYAPNGEKQSAEPMSGARHQTRLVFRATSRGEYYIRMSANAAEGKSYSLTIARARVFNTSIGAAAPVQAIPAGGLDQWRFPGATGDVIHVAARASGEGVITRLDFVPTLAAANGPATEEDSGDAYNYLPSDPKASGEIVAVLKKTGTYQLTVNQPMEVESTYALSTEKAIRNWNPNVDQDGSLKLGGSDYYAITGRAGEIFRVNAEAPALDVALDLFSPTGERLQTNDDGLSSRNAQLTWLIPREGRYLLRVHCTGDGGSGAYKLHRVANPVRTLVIGSKNEGTIGRGGSEIWSFTGKAGDVLIITVRSQEFDTFVSLIGPDAVEVGNNDDGGDSTDSLLSVRLPLSGTYTIWVSSRSGGGKYSVRLIADS